MNHKLFSDKQHRDQQEVRIEKKTYWMPALSHPLYVTKGLVFWKKPFERFWRPQCDCGRIFETLEDYHAHYVFKSLYGDDAS